jgi:lipopolysaccharide biosynthesis protein
MSNAPDGGVEPTVVSASRFGVVVHAFYPDLLHAMVRRVERLDAASGVLVTTTPDRSEDVERLVCRVGAERCEIHVVENRGRDVWPFLQVLSRCEELRWDVVLKLHTKRSDHREDGDAWRSELLSDLLDVEDCARTLSAFRAHERLGMVGPTRHRLNTEAYIGANRPRVTELGRRLGFEGLCPDASFFAGSMFYVRLSALAPLRALQLDGSDFEPELGQVDGTLAHALERCFPLAVESGGFTVRAMGDLHDRAVPAEAIRSGYTYALPTGAVGAPGSLPLENVGPEGGL